MHISEMTILLTGANGGIGREMAKALYQGGARLLLSSHNADELNKLAQTLAPDHQDRLQLCPCDLMQPREVQRLARTAEQAGVNVLINNAGMMQFGLLAQQSPAYLQQLLQLNTLAPMLLIQQLLPHLQQQPAAQIINVGSTFGSIGYPGFAAYSASKAAIYTFSEALRRELQDSAIEIKYLSPRATRTELNSPRVDAMNHALKVTVDQPTVVADSLLQLLGQSRPQLVIGWPEKWFVKLNRLFPALVDQAIRKQLPTIKRFANAA